MLFAVCDDKGVLIRINLPMSEAMRVRERYLKSNGRMGYIVLQRGRQNMYIVGAKISKKVMPNGDITK